MLQLRLFQPWIPKLNFTAKLCLLRCYQPVSLLIYGKSIQETAYRSKLSLETAKVKKSQLFFYFFVCFRTRDLDPKGALQVTAVMGSHAWVPMWDKYLKPEFQDEKTHFLPESVYSKLFRATRVTGPALVLILVLNRGTQTRGSVEASFHLCQYTWLLLLFDRFYLVYCLCPVLSLICTHYCLKSSIDTAKIDWLTCTLSSGTKRDTAAG